LNRIFIEALREFLDLPPLHASDYESTKERFYVDERPWTTSEIHGGRVLPRSAS
jgi:hypothetical protein